MKSNLYSSSKPHLVLLAAALLPVALVFGKTLSYLYANWQREEYSYGFLIPIISIYLVWQRRHVLASQPLRGAWSGVVIVALGLSLLFLDAAASVISPNAYALVIVITGCVVATFGWHGLRLMAAPVALLLLMVPLPTFWYNSLSADLQLISSELGVALIRAAGVSVFLEGNVIDLGSYKLQVAEACSGLRYLFPLITLGVIVAYMFRGRLWTRLLLVVSTLPIAVVMNSVRIGVIGVLVDRLGIAQAEGFLHQFEGWIVFMACFGLLLGECWLLFRLFGGGGDFRSAMGLEHAEEPDRAQDRAPGQSISRPGVAAAVLLLVSAYPAWAVPQRTELRPPHPDFARLQLTLGPWIGKREQLDRIYLDTLGLDDYLLANFFREGHAGSNAVINLYVAYYSSQRGGRAEHSPGACLPGGGWDVQGWQQHVVPGVLVNGQPLRVNRAIMQKGRERDLVYYWFEERGRDITNEYAAKLLLFKDAFALNRSDGSLVRLIVPLREAEDPHVGDEELRAFASAALPSLEPYLSR